MNWEYFMKRYCAFFVIFLCLSLVSALNASENLSKHIKFYVATNGNDYWSGTLAEPNNTNTDGPFFTIKRAQAEVRDLKTKNALARSVMVLIRDGIHFLDETLIFKPEDSGTNENPITYKAFPGENPIISGGKLVSGWQKKGTNLWVSQVKNYRNFRQLFINGQRRFRARTPDNGFFRIEENPGLAPDAKYNTPADKFKFAKGDIDHNWTNPRDIEIVVLHFWVDTHLPIQSIDEASQIVTFKHSSRRKLTDDFAGQGARYYVNNVLEGMDQPGEWYLNSSTGNLYYLSHPDEDLTTARVFAPHLEQLVRIEGDPKNQKWVEHIRFSGLSFQHTRYELAPGDAGDLQAASTVPGGIFLTGAKNINIKNCIIKNMGTYGIEFSNGCQKNQVVFCELLDLGAGGIRLNGGDAKSDPTLRTGNITITDNHLHHLGQIWHSGDGILSQHSGNNVFSHNHIHHLYYTGISVGWVWGYRPSVSVNNRIENNHIHHVGQKLLSDMGGVYLLGPSPGTVVSNNLIHDVQSWGYGGWGLYTDEGSSDILLENNIVYRTKSAGFHQHYGKENIIRNNTFAYGQEAQIQRSRNEDHLSFTFENNIVYYSIDKLIDKNWEGNNYRFDKNLYYRINDKPVKFQDWTFQEWKDRGQDIHSIISDPLFVDPEHDNFSLRKESPAFKLGFKPIDMTKVGPRSRGR